MRKRWQVVMLACLAPAAWAQQANTPADKAPQTQASAEKVPQTPADKPQSDPAQQGRHDRRPQVSSRQCGLGTDFNVLADSGGIWLYRDSGSPREIFFHGGELSVDRKLRPVSAADAQRLWQMESQARALMPKVAGLANEVVDLSYDALGGVIEIMTGSSFNARKIARMRTQAHGYVDGTLGKGRWEQDAFGGNFERYVEDQAEAFKGSIARHLLFQIFTGRSEAIEERADHLYGELDNKLETRSEAIEAQAEALCDQVDQLRALQDALEFRYEGKPLQLLEPIEGHAAADAAEDAEKRDAPDHSEEATSKQPAAAREDAPRDTTIKPRAVPHP
ncbi:DUF2884 family protein [Pseudoxanthomonas winnipegensis]|nr:DUF2884 family protein [Pseudoxanthomonas winnipegensis]